MCGALAWMAALVYVSLESARYYRAGVALPQNCTQPWDFRSQKRSLILVVVCMSRGAPGAFKSSRRSVCHQCGNTMFFELGGRRESCAVRGLAVLW